MPTRRTRESGSAIRFETDAADRDAAEEGQDPIGSPQSNAVAPNPAASSQLPWPQPTQLRAPNCLARARK